MAIGCSVKEKESKPLPRLINSKLFSDRGVDYVHGVVMLRLKQEPLLKSASYGDDGSIVINNEAKEALIQEQKVVLDRLKNISDKIELIYTYKLSINAIAVLVPEEFYDELRKVEGVASVQKRSPFNKIKTVPVNNSVVKKSQGEFDFTTADFLGAGKTGLTGKGIKVGIFDTGIDYTHAMLGGAGTVEVFESIDPTLETPLFPNAKVVGGIDLVGENFRPWSIHAPSAIPRPDSNPLDTSGHGSHVAGTTAGLGDGVNSFDGIAPEAELYAIKVFGAGGTGDDIVIAGIEWALDPNGDYDLSDRLDVANMSLGGAYGRSYNYYAESIANASDAGLVIVASAGNSGPIPYITGSPGATEKATSVGASVGGMEYLWKIAAVRFVLPSQTEPTIVELVEGAVSKPVNEVGELTGELAYIGDAAEDLTEEQIAAVKGKVAFIDRGKVSFVEKLTRAYDAGAIAVVVANNKPGDAAFVMGGEGSIDLPSLMVTKEQGDTFKDSLTKGSVTIAFNKGDIIEKAELIDTITSFSSQGPRVGDGLLKPEVIAPGYQVISASVGTGSEAVKLNGTSMAAPQVAGVYALLKQARPDLSAQDLKAMLIGSAKTLVDEKTKKAYSFSRQGAGRVQVDKAVNISVIAEPATLTLGQLDIIKKKTVKRSITFKNIVDSKVSYALKFDHESNLSIVAPETVELESGESKTVDLLITVTKDFNDTPFKEFNVMIKLMQGSDEMLRVPLIGVIRSLSAVELSNVKIQSTSLLDSVGAVSEVEMVNNSSNSAYIELFNLIGLDDKKPFELGLGLFKGRACDLQALGHRIVKKEGREYLQFGVKLFNPLAVWDVCEVSIQIDTNGDDQTDLELGGTLDSNLDGLSALVPEQNKHYSVLIDSAEAKKIRLVHEEKVRIGEGDSTDAIDYKTAILGLSEMTIYNQSTVAIVEVESSLIPVRADGRLKVKASTLAGSDSDVETDDFFGLEEKWHLININEASLGYIGLPEAILLGAQEHKKVVLQKGAGTHELLALMPLNLSVQPDNVDSDKQMVILKPMFTYED
jgi:minor extracellular serine protease Vpr